MDKQTHHEIHIEEVNKHQHEQKQHDQQDQLLQLPQQAPHQYQNHEQPYQNHHALVMEEDKDVVLTKDQFILSKLSKIQDHYAFSTKKNLLGEGGYGKVAKATHKLTGEPRAIKILPKNKISNLKRFEKEIETMKNLDHPHIIKLYETYEDTDNIYLVMELCTGGDLIERIINKGNFTECEARKCFSQIVKAIHYCHEHNICHRDLKPENFLLVDDSDDAPIKVIDFGFAHDIKSIIRHNNQYIFDNKVNLSSKLGTTYYMAPEVLNGSYDELCDIWSLGVTLYILLCGYPPFYGDNDSITVDCIKKGIYDYNGIEWKDISSSAKDLIDHMLCKASTRYHTKDILNHEWMQMKDNNLDNPLQINFSAIISYRNAKKLKKAALAYIASQLSERDIRDLSCIFELLDINNDGIIGFNEIQASLMDMDEKKLMEIKQLLEGISKDRSGNLNYTEFIAATMEKACYLREERLQACFKIFDKEGDGKITADELKEVLGNNAQITSKSEKEYWEKMIKEADMNGDGTIDYQDFAEMMTHT